MAVEFKKDGFTLRKPPYTKAEENEIYGRMAGGPITVALSSRLQPQKRPNANVD